jgi:hypothetical protein
MCAKAKVSNEHCVDHACMRRRGCEGVNAPASEENRRFFELLPKRDIMIIDFITDFIYNMKVG